jgi:TonB family protein
MLGIIAAAAAGLAQGPAPVPDVSTKWVSHWGDSSCWLLRAAEKPSGAVLAIKKTPGNDQLEIRIVEPGWKSPLAGEADRLNFILDDGGGPLAGKTGFIPDDPFYQHSALDRARTAFATTDRSVAARLAGATSVSVVAYGTEVARAALPTMRKAMDALRECENDALKAWDIDPAPLAALRSAPRPVEGAPPVIKNDDYPLALLRAGVSGTVVVRLAIDAEGKPTGCTVVEKSGQEVLDQLTCSLYLKRARLQPAVGASGGKVPADYVTPVRWLTSSEISR